MALKKTCDWIGCDEELALEDETNIAVYDAKGTAVHSVDLCKAHLKAALLLLDTKLRE